MSPTAKIHIRLTICVGENGRINAVTTRYGFGLRLERPRRGVAGSDAHSEYILFVLHGKVQVVCSILMGCIGRLQLPTSLGNILQVQCNAMICHLTTDTIHRKDTIIAHVEVSPFVILRHVGFNIVRWINVNSTIEHMRGWVGGMNMADQRFRLSDIGCCNKAHKQQGQGSERRVIEN